MLLTYLAGRDLYTALKEEIRGGDPQWADWHPMLYAWEDEFVTTLHHSVRLRADAILRRLEMVQTNPGANWDAVARRALNRRLVELEELLAEASPR